MTGQSARRAPRAPRGRGAVRARAAALLAAGLIAAAGLAFVTDRPAVPGPAPTRAAARPTLMLLTSLPLVFGEEFGLDGGGSPALKALESRFTVVPVALADAASLGRGRLLLMAHPLAQPAEALVDLDRWVRGGGRLLLLADPMLEWPSERRLGDPLRPPPAFADTGLLAHWGLRLDSPDERGPRQLTLGGRPILAASPGRLAASGGVGASGGLAGKCAVSGDDLVARCRIGKGAATIVADADFLNVENLDGPTAGNVEAMLAELAALGR